MSIQLIIFDLGKVVFDFDLMPAYKELAEITGRSVAQGIAEFKVGEALENYERGDLTTEQYREYVSRMMNYPFSEKEFSRMWNCIFTVLVPGIENLIAKLKSKYRVVALSNTNDLHSQQWQQQFPMVDSWFDAIYQSHQIRHRKPEPESYLWVLREQNCNPDDALFIDDMPENIAGAKNLGMQAHLFESTIQLRAMLKHSSIL